MCKLIVIVSLTHLATEAVLLVLLLLLLPLLLLLLLRVVLATVQSAILQCAALRIRQLQKSTCTKNG